jgi:hypothetical protein
MATFAPKKYFQKSPYTIDPGFLLSPQCENSPKKNNNGTKGVFGEKYCKSGHILRKEKVICFTLFRQDFKGAIFSTPELTCMMEKEMD